MNDQVFEDQAQRNQVGFHITCQIEALIDTLSNEKDRHDELPHFRDLLNALLPRLDDLNNAVMALFTDEHAFGGGELERTVYGSKDGAKA